MSVVTLCEYMLFIRCAIKSSPNRELTLPMESIYSNASNIGVNFDVREDSSGEYGLHQISAKEAAAHDW